MVFSSQQLEKKHGEILLHSKSQAKEPYNFISATGTFIFIVSCHRYLLRYIYITLMMDYYCYGKVYDDNK